MVYYYPKSARASYNPRTKAFSASMRGRGRSSKIGAWAKKAGSDINAFLKRSKILSRLGRMGAEYIPAPAGRELADLGLDVLSKEGYGRRRGRRMGRGIRLAGAGRC